MKYLDFTAISIQYTINYKHKHICRSLRFKNIYRIVDLINERVSTQGGIQSRKK